MTGNRGFERREEGFEAKVHLEGEQRFRLEMKRDKLFATWAAAQLGMDDEQTKSYQAELCKEDLTEPGDEDVIRRVLEQKKTCERAHDAFYGNGTQSQNLKADES